MTDPLVSIVMTNYNKEKYLREAIQSIVNQTYKNWELILIDDGSTDSSRDIIKSFKDQRIKPFYRNTNGHICVATNEGLGLANGRYIARLDSDDVMYPDRLQIQVDFLKENPTFKVCFTKLDIIDESSKVINERENALYKLYNRIQKDQGAWLRFFFSEGNSLIQGTMMYDASIIKEIGVFNLAYVQAHDFDFLVRIAKKYEYGFIDKAEVGYRRTAIQNSSVNAKNDLRFFNEYMLIRKHFFEDMEDEVFTRAFGEFFRNKEACTPEELACEKAFLLLHGVDFSNKNPVLGMMSLEELLNDKTYADLLAEKYNFTPMDYYQENFNHQYYSPVMHHSKQKLLERINELEELQAAKEIQIEELSNLAKSQNDVIVDMKDSISWKLTRPLRGMKRIIGS